MPFQIGSVNCVRSISSKGLGTPSFSNIQPGILKKTNSIPFTIPSITFFMPESTPAINLAFRSTVISPVSGLTILGTLLKPSTNPVTKSNAEIRNCVKGLTSSFIPAPRNGISFNF